MTYSACVGGALRRPRAGADAERQFRVPADGEHHLAAAGVFGHLRVAAEAAAHGLRLRRAVLPGGAIIPCAALTLIAWLLASSSWAETRDVMFLLLLGVLLYLSARRRGEREDHG